MLLLPPQPASNKAKVPARPSASAMPSISILFCWSSARCAVIGLRSVRSLGTKLATSLRNTPSQSPQSSCTEMMRISERHSCSARVVIDCPHHVAKTIAHSPRMLLASCRLLLCLDNTCIQHLRASCACGSAWIADAGCISSFALRHFRE